MITYTFECNKCGNKITTREPEHKHASILNEAGWEHYPGLDTHICRECRPKAKIECVNGCGSRMEHNTTGKYTKEEQLRDAGWVESDGEWFCDDHCCRDNLFGI